MRLNAASASANAGWLGGETMCPSFQATREEKQSTRGRAHLLFEMTRAETIKDGWRSAEVREALSELLLATPTWQPPRLAGKAVLHTHCHHKAVLDATAQIKMLEALGLDVEEQAAGCCGHAGAFGYEIEHYPVSMKIGEQDLLPKVRKTPRDIIVVADGFSCRQRIKDGASRWAMHPAEVIALALETSRHPERPVSERRYLEVPAALNTAALVSTAVIGASAISLLALALAAARGHYRRLG